MSDVRLIDANNFKKFLQALCEAGAPYDDVIQLLDKEPTAYDVERVVNELEKEKQILRWLKNDTIALSDSEVIAIEEKAYNFAIKLVRKGGAE